MQKMKYKDSIRESNVGTMTNYHVELLKLVLQGTSLLLLLNIISIIKGGVGHVVGGSHSWWLDRTIWRSRIGWGRRLTVRVWDTVSILSHWHLESTETIQRHFSGGIIFYCFWITISNVCQQTLKKAFV